MPQKVTLRMVDGVSVVVPDSLDLLTTYVLREQADWFEDEIKFVRLLLRPRQQAIDIGANYGLFALSMAKAVGADGKIWAFEPASSTAAFLAQSIEANEFSQIVLDRRALSEKPGSAQLALNDNSELNELVRGAGATGAAETVALTTLDDAMGQYGWRDIDFVKIDAEGEEAAILRGGRRFFQSTSPLVQYEVKAGGNVHLELVSAFQDLGYSSYRLVPGINVLVPFDPGEEIDPYLLNLFCCKPDRAEIIAADGRLARIGSARNATAARPARDMLRRLDLDSAYGWSKVLTRLPYGKRLAPTWQQTVDRKQSLDVESALALHATAHDGSLPATERALALRASYDILKAACDAEPKFLRYASLARVAREHGARFVAVAALEKLFNYAMTERRVDLTEPFLAASPYYDAVDPGADIGNWVVCSTLEELERNGWFSSFYSGASARQRLEIIRNCGFGSPEMAQRLMLVEQRYAGAGG